MPLLAVHFPALLPALVLLVHFPVVVVPAPSDYDCLPDCECDAVEKLMTCSGPNVHTLPVRLPFSVESLTIRNASNLYTIPKHGFRRLDRLREIRFVNCERLETIEKFAFKGLRRLKLVSFSGCPSLTEIVKGVFSNIQNEDQLTVLFSASPLRTIHAGAFRHSSRLRTVSIAGESLHIQRHAFSSITQLDFLTLSGVAKIDSNAFTNSTRFHIVDIYNSNLELEPYAFSNLAHVHQILIQRSRIGVIPTETFAGLTTVELLELYDNEIGVLSPHAFTGSENIGRIKLARNRIAKMESPDAVAQGDAIQLLLKDNIVRCTCELKWMSHHADVHLIDGNYCGNEGAHRSVRSFLRYTCYEAGSEYGVMTQTNQVPQARPKAASPILGWAFLRSALILILAFIL